MQNAVSYQAELDHSKVLIRDYVPMLGKHGFEYEKTEVVQSALTGDSIQFTFFNKKTATSMRISYSPSLNNMRRLFVVTLKRSGEREQLFLDQYLESHKRSDLLPYFMDGGRVLEMRVFWNGLFGDLDSLFSNELKEVIVGTKWEGTPFDWDGYK